MYCIKFYNCSTTMPLLVPGHLIKDHSQHKGGGGDTDLLQLVRRLSSTDHVKMGANVSRHSAKGLSGRRSQSSGSICNGKGRHPDGKICSSLPSYLDDRQSNGCNNNHHECEKPPLDEVQFFSFFLYLPHTGCLLGEDVLKSKWFFFNSLHIEIYKVKEETMASVSVPEIQNI